MLSILEVVRDGYLGPINDDQSEYLRRLDRRARTMLALVNELMALSRNRQRREVESGVTELAALARRVQRTFQDKGRRKTDRLSGEPVDRPPDVRGRLETVEQMLENLVSNAIKYTPADGSVESPLSNPGDGTVRIEVSDTGIGIPAADRPKLFTGIFPGGERQKPWRRSAPGWGWPSSRKL